MKSRISDLKSGNVQAQTNAMGNPIDVNLKSNASDVMLCAFALADCVVHVDSQIAKYLRAVHRTALELAVPNLFGLEIGGYWLTSAQINQLRTLPDCYPSNEVNLVRRAVECYLLAQTEGLDADTGTLSSLENPLDG